MECCSQLGPVASATYDVGVVRWIVSRRERDVVSGWRRRAKQDDESARPEYLGEPPPTSYKMDDVHGTPPPEYCPRPAADTHQRAKVKSRFHPDSQATEPGTDVPGSPANRSMDQSGYADLGLAAVGGTLPHGTEAAVSGDPSVNRSLRPHPRRANQSTDAAPLGYVNRSFSDDTGVSDRPTRGEAPRPARKPRRSSRDARPDDSSLPSGLPRDTSSVPAGSQPGDRSFEIVAPGSDADDMIPLTNVAKGGPDDRPQTGVDNSAFDRLFPPSKPNSALRPTGAGRSYENIVVAPPGDKPDRRLNRSYDPSSYLPDSMSLAAGGRQGSEPDMRQRAGNATIQFNTDTQAIDV